MTKRIFKNSFMFLWFLLLLLPILLVIFSVFRTGDITTAVSWLTSDFFRGLTNFIGISDFISFLKTTIFKNIATGQWLDFILNSFVYYTIVNLIGLFFNFINWIIELSKEWFNGLSKKI